MTVVTHTYVLFRADPASWRERLIAHLDAIGVRGDAVARFDRHGEVRLTEQQLAELRTWVEAHGDAFDDVFRSERKLKPKAHPIGIRLKPGESAMYPARELPEELRAGILDLQSVAQTGSRVTMSGRVPRVIPNSGLLGKMGSYEITLEIDDVERATVEDPRDLRAIHVTVGHFDPTDHILHLGSPRNGSIELVTGADRYRVSIAENPVQVRRWRQWRDA